MSLPISPYTVLTENKLAVNKSYPVITMDTKITAAVDIGARLNLIAIYNNGGIVTFNIGRTLGGSEIYSGTLDTLTSDTYIPNTIDVSAVTDIYFSSANWNAAEFYVVIQTEAIYQIV